MKCTNCSTENMSDARFCIACGVSMDSEPTQSEESNELTVVVKPTEIHSDEFLLNKRFRVIKKLGKGGMGEVLLAEDVKLKRNVAIKSILIKDSLGDTNAKLRFLREAQTASQLDHSNICTIYEIYEEQDKDYIVMQYIDGVTLDQIIRTKKISIEKIVDIAIQVCSGMMEAHSKDIIHRDIKPGNMMVDKKGVVKILDFGLAKFGDESSSKNQMETNLTEKGFVMGTIAYISPEQARGKSLDKRTDVFSFGAVLFEMVEGENPFKVDEQIETLYNVLNKDVKFTRAIPIELEDIIRKALEKDREKRYADFSQMKDDLETFKTLYTNLKDKKNEEGLTELIDVEEKSKLMEEIQKTSDKENLGDLVYRIKKFNASTERVVTAPPSVVKKKLKWIIPAAIVFLAVVLVSIFFMTRGGDEKKINQPIKETQKFYVYVRNFENTTGESNISEMVSYLMMESLNQFPQFETIDKETVDSLGGEGDENTKLATLKKKFNITYILSGKVSKDRDFYTIDADLNSINNNRNKADYHFTTTAPSKDSFLINQLTDLSKKVYAKLSPDESSQYKLKAIKDIFGKQWDKFSYYLAGVSAYKKGDVAKAKSNFLKAQGFIASQYYLAEVCIYDGNRKDAQDLIKSIMPDIDKLTNALSLRVRAIDARLKFDFPGAIVFLEGLKDELPFSKEVLYQLGEAYFAKADPEKAMIYYNKALELDPQYSQALNHLGYCNSYLGSHDTAIELFEKFRTLDESSNSFDSLGDGYFFSGDLLNAENMKSHAVLPDDSGNIISWPFQTLADIYILEAQYIKANEALESYRKLEKNTKGDAYQLEKQAYIDYLEQRYPQGLEKINQSLGLYDSDDINETSYEAHWIKGLLLLVLNKTEESKTELEWLGKFKSRYNLNKDNFHAALKLYLHLDAMVAEIENRQSDAEKSYKAILEMKNSLSYWITYFDYQFFHTEYAAYLARTKQYEKALKEIDLCLEFNLNYPPALRVKAEMLEKLNRKNDARSIYNQLNEIYGTSSESNFFRNYLKSKLK